MTVTGSKLNKASSIRALRVPSLSGLALGVLSALALFLIFKYPDVAIDRMTSALELCAKTVVPSLFPFMVLSELLVSGNAIAAISPLLRRPARALFGISGEGAAAVVLGLFCGFPIGAKSAVSLYKQGRIDRSELTRLLTFSNNPSSAFLISAVGASMFKSRPLGVLLFTVSTLSALTVGIAGKYAKRKSSDRSSELYVKLKVESKSGVDKFTGAITSSALSIIYVCAFVVFFSTLVGVLEHTLSASSLPHSTAALLFGFFELTGGMWKASQIPKYGIYLAAAISGWSGLSVHFQIMSICSGCGISFKPYILSKLAAGLLNVIFLLILSAAIGLPV